MLIVSWLESLLTFGNIQRNFPQTPANSRKISLVRTADGGDEIILLLSSEFSDPNESLRLLSQQPTHLGSSPACIFDIQGLPIRVVWIADD